MPDEDTNAALDRILNSAALRVDDARVARSSLDLSTWAESRSARRRTARVRLAVLGLLGVALASGTAVTATALGPELAHNADQRWVYQATNGQTCDLWTRIDAGAPRGAIEAADAAYLRGLLDDIDISSIDLAVALRETPPGADASIGHAEGLAIVLYVHRHLFPDRLPDGRTPDVTIQSWVDCDEAPE